MYVIVGVFKGVIDSVAIKSTMLEARAVRSELDKEYEIERNEDGYESENDVGIFECEVDGENGDLVL